jgi:hypothetical protein
MKNLKKHIKIWATIQLKEESGLKQLNIIKPLKTMKAW